MSATSLSTDPIYLHLCSHPGPIGICGIVHPRKFKVIQENTVLCMHCGRSIGQDIYEEYGRDECARYAQLGRKEW